MEFGLGITTHGVEWESKARLGRHGRWLRSRAADPHSETHKLTLSFPFLWACIIHRQCMNLTIKWPFPVFARVQPARSSSLPKTKTPAVANSPANVVEADHAEKSHLARQDPRPGMPTGGRGRAMLLP